jgi:hypothetical protein
VTPSTRGLVVAVALVSLCARSVAAQANDVGPVLAAVAALVRDSLVPMSGASTLSIDPRPLGTHGPASQAVAADQLFPITVLNAVAKPGRITVVSQDRARDCKKQSKPACYDGEYSLNLYLTLGMPTVREDSATVRGELTTAQKLSPPPSGSVYEFTLVKRNGTWVVVRTRRLAGS